MVSNLLLKLLDSIKSKLVQQLMCNHTFLKMLSELLSAFKMLNLKSNMIFKNFEGCGFLHLFLFAFDFDKRKPKNYYNGSCLLGSRG